MIPTPSQQDIELPRIIAILGGQWGDEGKGKIIDWAGEYFDITARATGGNNAGHTVYLNGEKHVFHLLPSSITWQHLECFLGSGMVLDPLVLLQEIATLQEKGFPVSSLFVSGEAHLILFYHKLVEDAQEEQRGAAEVGTTRRGIGPAYVDKFQRCGIRVNDLLDSGLYTKVKHQVHEKRELLRHLYGIKEEELILRFQHSFPRNIITQEYQHLITSVHSVERMVEVATQIYHSLGKRLQPFLGDVRWKIKTAVHHNKRILVEGAQGILLDIDHGTYPFVTSSSPSLGGINTGLGLSQVDQAYSVIKAYTTRVGKGSFPTELKENLGQLLRERGSEYGSTTGRPRRCGWLDAVLLRHTVATNGSKLIVNKLDILTGISPLRICNSYRYLGPTRMLNGEIYFTGKIIKDFVSDGSILTHCVPHEWIEVEGWTTPIMGLTDPQALPPQVWKYLKVIEEHTGGEVCVLSTGPAREHTIPLIGKWPFIHPAHSRSRPRYRGIIYDLDNTLVATDNFVVDVMHKAVSSLGNKYPIPRPSDLEIRTVLKKNLPFEEIFQHLFPNPPFCSDSEPLSSLVLTKYRELASPLPYRSTAQGVPTVVYLHQQRIVQGIVTNRRRMAEERLKQAGYTSFDFLFAPEHDEDLKPSPRALDPALAVLTAKGIPRSEILCVGDHLDDYRAAHAAGVDFVAVTTGVTSKEEFIALGVAEAKIVSHLGELKKVVGEGV